MLNVRTFDDMAIVNARASLQHPLADEVSVAIGDGTMSHFPHSVELAFFRDGEYSEEIIFFLAPWYTSGVYGYVPLHVFADFLRDWKVQ